MNQRDLLYGNPKDNKVLGINTIVISGYLTQIMCIFN